jgi:hypothetical protein
VPVSACDRFLNNGHRLPAGAAAAHAPAGETPPNQAGLTSNRAAIVVSGQDRWMAATRLLPAAKAPRPYWRRTACTYFGARRWPAPTASAYRRPHTGLFRGRRLQLFDLRPSTTGGLVVD